MRAKLYIYSFFILMLTVTLGACSRYEVNIYTPSQSGANPVDPSKPMAGPVKGTLLSGKTYTMSDNITINSNDTLILQSGVTLKVAKGKTILVKGKFISLGTKDKPNRIIPDIPIGKTDQVGASITNDSAYCGYWCGINCDPSCTLLDLKWTHLEFAGAKVSSDFVPVGEKAGDISYVILFQNTKGDFILEDSWLYGNVDDAIRVSTGRFEIMRNTFEKNGYTGGESINVKSGGVGDIAYNLFIGSATNGSKASNKGGSSVQTNVNMYNNTYICGGYRQSDPTGRGGSINYEEGSKGYAYNNLMVDCRTGIRICNNPAADVGNMHYGFNYSYGDSAKVCNMIYPVDPTQSVTVPQSTDIPAFTQLLSNPNYQQAYLYTLSGGVCVNYVMPYDGSAFVGLNNPLFVNFPLPIKGLKRLSDVSAIGSFDFHLSSNSPAIGRGTTSFSPINIITDITDPSWAPTVTNPGKDMGCYQNDGTGNQH